MKTHHDNKERAPTSDGLLRWIVVLIAIPLVVVIFRLLPGLLQPLFLALFLFYLGAPLSRRLAKKNVPTIAAHFILIGSAVLVLGLFGWMGVRFGGEFVDQLPGYTQNLQDRTQNGLDFIATRFPSIADKLSGAQIDKTALVKKAQGALGSLFGNVLGMIGTAFLVLIYLLLINQEASSLPKRLKSAFNKEQYENVMEIGSRINNGIISFVYVKSIASLLVGVCTTLILLFFGIQHPFFWGGLAFFANFIPYVGSVIGAFFPAVFGIIVGETVGTMGFMVIILMLVQMAIGNVIEPKLAGKTLNLSPLVVFLSLSFWGWLWGLVGLILGIPIMVSLKIVLENIPTTRKVAAIMSNEPIG